MNHPNRHDKDGKPLSYNDKVNVYSERKECFCIPGKVVGPGSGMFRGSVIVDIDNKYRESARNDFEPGWLSKVEDAT